MMKISPFAIALAVALLGCGLVVAGIYLLVGLGWGCVAAGVPCLGLSMALVKGLSRGA